MTPTTSEAHRWQAAMGAITGALIGGATAAASNTWSAEGAASIGHAEAWLDGAIVPLDLTTAEAVPVAIGLSGQAAPLLVDTATVELIDHVRGWLNEAQAIEFHDPALARAAEVVASSPGDFVGALKSSPTQIQPLVGALVGLRFGIGAIPARRVAALTCPEAKRGRRYLSRLCDRLLKVHRIDWYDPRNRRGPKEVLPGIWVANLYGISAFAAEHPDGLVVSLCDVEGRLDHHEHRLTFHLDDTPKADANPVLDHVLHDVMHEIRSARTAGQPVLVHCRHGASRTGLVLRLLLIEEHGLDADDALTEAQCLWPHTSTWNTAWARQVDRWAEQATATRLG